MEKFFSNSKGKKLIIAIALLVVVILLIIAIFMVIGDSDAQAAQMTIVDTEAEIHEVYELDDEVLVGPYTVTITDVDESKIKSITATLTDSAESAKITDDSGNDKETILNNDTVYVKMSRADLAKDFSVKFTAKIKQGIIKKVTLEEVATFTHNPEVTIGKIKLNVLDQKGQSVSGAKFALKDSEGDTLIETTSGADGLITYYKVPEGEYTLEEIEKPQGYTVEKTAKTITVIGGKTTAVKFLNNIITGSLVITKVDDANNVISGVTFDIYDNSDTPQVISQIVTDENGKASIDLEYGTYYFQEVSAPSGYIMDTTIYALTIDGEQREYNATVTNEREKGHILIIRTKEDGTPVEGVVYDILDSNKEKVVSTTTNEEGKAGVMYLPLGTYYYQEVSVPDGVSIDNGVYEFKVESEGQIVRKEISI